MHVMIDLETMSTQGDAAIIAIGAAAFEPTKKSIAAQFYMKVDLASAMDLGSHVSASTILWWLEQDDAARAEFRQGTHPIKVVLEQFFHWLKDVASPMYVWGNGPLFDILVLETAFKAARMSIPWSFRNVRDYRTIAALKPEITAANFMGEGVKHNALHDAIAQARLVQAVYAGL